MIDQEIDCGFGSDNSEIGILNMLINKGQTAVDEFNRLSDTGDLNP